MALLANIILILALATSIGATIAAGTSVFSKKPHRFSAFAGYGILIVAALYTVAMIIMVFSFINLDFSLKIVSSYASSDMPKIYLLSALYADKAGSVFFCGWLLTLMAAIMVYRSRDEKTKTNSSALVVLGMMIVFFLTLVTVVSNVFQQNTEVVAEGWGLNPLLRNAGMLVHPPLLYLGFAAFLVVFGMVIASLFTGEDGTKWTLRVRRWSLFGWACLGIGNLIGMWWSYNELGWGGYWAWDPVENAGLIPWLLGTAFVHSIAMRRRKNYLHTWSLGLIIATAASIFFSPFVTHGGVESPLHGFVGSTYPPFILAAILLILIGSFALLWRRKKEFAPEKEPASLVSREGAFLITNLIFLLLVILMLAGMLTPQLTGLLSGRQVALERDFYDRTCGPVLLALVVLMGVCPVLGWGKATWRSSKKMLLYPLAGALLVAVVILIGGWGNWYAVAALVGGFTILTIFWEWILVVRSRLRAGKENICKACTRLFTGNRPRYGGQLVHLGIAVITIGIIGSSFYSLENTETLDVGDTVSIGQYELTYDQLTLTYYEDRLSAMADVIVTRDDKVIAGLQPERIFWMTWYESFSEVAVRTTLEEDLFVSLVWTSYQQDDPVLMFRVLVNPLVVWIWIGGAIMLLGGIVAFWPGGVPVSLEDLENKP